MYFALQDLNQKTQFFPTSGLKGRNSMEMSAIFYKEHKIVKNFDDENQTQV